MQTFKHIHKQRAIINKAKNDRVYSRQELQPDLFPAAEPENHEGPWRCSVKPHDGWRNFINPNEIVGLLT